MMKSLSLTHILTMLVIVGFALLATQLTPNHTYQSSVDQVKFIQDFNSKIKDPSQYKTINLSFDRATTTVGLFSSKWPAIYFNELPSLKFWVNEVDPTVFVKGQSFTLTYFDLASEHCVVSLTSNTPQHLSVEISKLSRSPKFEHCHQVPKELLTNVVSN